MQEATKMKSPNQHLRSLRKPRSLKSRRLKGPRKNHEGTPHCGGASGSACLRWYLYHAAGEKKASAQRPDPDSDYTEDEEEYAIPEEDKSESFEDGSDYDTKPDGSKE